MASARAISSRRWSPYESARASSLRVRGDAAVVEELVRAPLDAGFLGARARAAQDRADHAGARPQVPPDHHVLERGHVGEEADVLERARDAVRGDAVRLQPAHARAAEADCRPRPGRRRR